jgi:hypothetical protein
MKKQIIFPIIGILTLTFLSTFFTATISHATTDRIIDCTPLINTNTTYRQSNFSIVLLQECLRQAGTFNFDGGNTGYFGDVTQKALTDYRVKRDLEIASLAKVQTIVQAPTVTILSAINSKLLCENDLNSRTIRNEKNDDIRKLQQCLREAGFFRYEGGNTGFFGEITQDALNRYIAQRGNLGGGEKTTIGLSSGNDQMDKAFDTFYSIHKGQRWPDPIGYSHGECVSLSKRWQNFLGASYGIWPGTDGSPSESFDAYLLGNKAMAPDNNTFTISVISSVENIKKGDIVVTKQGRLYSHTAIATGLKDERSLEVIEQNNPIETGVVKVGSISLGSFKGALRMNRR